MRPQHRIANSLRLELDTRRDDLVGRIQRGEDAAFAILFRTHYASLCDFVNSLLRAPDVAEEVVQSVFLSVWEHRRSWNPQGDARAFLFASCRNRAVDLLRHERIVARTEQQGTAMGVGNWSTSQPTDAGVEAEELSERLREAVARLPERRRLVVILRWQHQLTNPEIASVLRISVKGVEMQFSRALVDLRRHLGTRVLDLL
jgi:RNA polymerase sigma-70 factor (family 1)